MEENPEWINTEKWRDSLEEQSSFKKLDGLGATFHILSILLSLDENRNVQKHMNNHKTAYIYITGESLYTGKQTAEIQIFDDFKFYWIAHDGDFVKSFSSSRSFPSPASL